MTEQLTVDDDLDEEEMRVLTVLRAHRGRSHRISARHLAIQAGLGGIALYHRAAPRAVQTIIHRLRLEHGIAIGSTAGRPAGYWLIETAEELRDCCQEIRDRSLSGLAVEAALRHIHLPELLGQLAIEVAR